MRLAQYYSRLLLSHSVHIFRRQARFTGGSILPFSSARYRQESIAITTQHNDSFRKDFSFFPNFFNDAEQKILLRGALRRLDAMGTREMKRKRRDIKKDLNQLGDAPASLFLPDEFYEFEEGHYDGVIKYFREMHLTEWDAADTPLIEPLLTRLRSLVPRVETQTHLLHLASKGEIFPHIDNTEASGSWILGVSLGGERVMRMQNAVDQEDTFDVCLPSGSVYIQQDQLRFQYNHAVLNHAVYEGRNVGGGQRLSIMLRDRPPAARWTSAAL